VTSTCGNSSGSSSSTIINSVIAINNQHNYSMDVFVLNETHEFEFDSLCSILQIEQQLSKASGVTTRWWILKVNQSGNTFPDVRRAIAEHFVTLSDKLLLIGAEIRKQNIK
jgi:hypothetical protein